MNYKIEEIEDSIKQYLLSRCNVNLLSLSKELKGEFNVYTFTFEEQISFLKKIDICIYDFGNELSVKLFGHNENTSIQFSLYKLFTVIKEDVIPNWFPELFLSFSFKSISLPGFYKKFVLTNDLSKEMEKCRKQIISLK